MTRGAAPSAVGVRQSYADISPVVRRWVDDQLGASVIEARTQQGGMSPGCAARLRTADGRAAFVKAVSADTNPRTPELFRHEIAVLSRLAPVDYRPALLATYDDGTWVAVLLEDVEGVHPDLDDPSHAAAVWSMVEAQSRELTPPPRDLRLDTAADGARRWAEGWATMSAGPDTHLPDWATQRFDELLQRVQTLDDRLPVDSLCHWDVRNDNLLLRPDGSVVIVDWGMARLGPAWSDLFVLCLTWADRPEFDVLADRVDADPEVVTDLLLALGGWGALQSTEPAPPGIPTMRAFQRREAERFLSAAHRRLHARDTWRRRLPPALP
jgi:aminoglycoside phosphotransferase